MPVAGQTGFIARVDAASANLEYTSDADLLRTVYDDSITTEFDNVPLDAGAGWVVLDTWSLVTLLTTDDRIRTMTFDLSVRDGVTTVVSPVTVRGAVRRDDTFGDSVYSIDDGNMGASATWSVTLFGAAGTLALRLVLAGDVLTFEAQASTTSDRTIRGELYLGVVRQ
jgi:hypothetical protein